MDDVMIPDEVVEAMKQTIALAIYQNIEADVLAHQMTEDEFGMISAAAARAMLKAWPGASREPKHLTHSFIILPLPQETKA